VQTAHSIIRPPDCLTIEYPTCATILDPLHQISYSCHDPHRRLPCRICHLHTTRQANTILQQEIKIKVKLPKYPGFEFKHR
jgi:hypothetical protein